MKKLAKLFAKPKLNSPVMLAVWPGIGNVAVVVANYLLDKLEFRDLAELDATHFFDPIGVMARDSVVEAPRFPESRFYYWKNKKGIHDVILFVGDDQPLAKVYELAGTVLDVAQTFAVSRVYTCAAAPTKIHFTETPRTWAVATDKELVSELRRQELVQKGTIQIAGLNGLLLGMAKERDIEGICLLAEVPAQTARMENPVASLALIKVFTRLLEFEVDTAGLAEAAHQTTEQVKQANAIAMGEYLEHFTEPIWEQDGGEDDEDNEDDAGPEDDEQIQN